MFTGLIEGVCLVKSASKNLGAMRLSVDLGPLAEGCKAADSVAINGACLTITALSGGIADFDVSEETLGKSTLGELSAGTTVNIERAVSAEGRFGGHFVQGHIDGTGRIERIEQAGQCRRVRFVAEPELLGYIVIKGSVAIDGISLTVADVDGRGFEVVLIPETLGRTNLARAKVSDRVNIETDLLAKIVKKQLQSVLPQPDRLTVEKLEQMGF